MTGDYSDFLKKENKKEKDSNTLVILKKISGR